MRGRWIALALGALTIAGVSAARAEEAGCCETECHTDDGSGRGLHSMQRRDMTQSECERSGPDCRATWRPEACDSVGGSVGVIREPDEEDEE